MGPNGRSAASQPPACHWHAPYHAMRLQLRPFRVQFRLLSSASLLPCLSRTPKGVLGILNSYLGSSLPPVICVSELNECHASNVCIYSVDRCCSLWARSVTAAFCWQPYLVDATPGSSPENECCCTSPLLRVIVGLGWAPLSYPLQETIAMIYSSEVKKSRYLLFYYALVRFEIGPCGQMLIVFSSSMDDTACLTPSM